jgi:hypothetical protein
MLPVFQEGGFMLKYNIHYMSIDAQYLYIAQVNSNIIMQFSSPSQNVSLCIVYSLDNYQPHLLYLPARLLKC